MTIVILRESGTRLIIALSPVLEVILGNGLKSSLLLKALKSSIMFLVQPPVLVVGDPVAIQFFRDRVVCPDASL